MTVSETRRHVKAQRTFRNGCVVAARLFDEEVCTGAGGAAGATGRCSTSCSLYRKRSVNVLRLLTRLVSDKRGQSSCNCGMQRYLQPDT